MTMVRADCEHGCGSIQNHTSKFLLLLAVQPNPSFYQFACPVCRRFTTRSATVEVIALLSSVHVRACPIPDEAYEVHDGLQVNADDLLDFLLQLADSGPYLAAELTPPLP